MFCFSLVKTAENPKPVKSEIISEDHMKLSLKNIFYVFSREKIIETTIGKKLSGVWKKTGKMKSVKCCH